MSENIHTAHDIRVMTAMGVILGMFVGGLAAVLVSAVSSTEYKKEMIELGVGSYNSRTGAFEVTACTK